VPTGDLLEQKVVERQLPALRREATALADPSGDTWLCRACGGGGGGESASDLASRAAETERMQGLAVVAAREVAAARGRLYTEVRWEAYAAGLRSLPPPPPPPSPLTLADCVQAEEELEVAGWELASAVRTGGAGSGSQLPWGVVPAGAVPPPSRLPHDTSDGRGPTGHCRIMDSGDDDDDGDDDDESKELEQLIRRRSLLPVQALLEDGADSGSVLAHQLVVAGSWSSSSSPPPPSSGHRPPNRTAR
jgi:hypothetical protein